MDTKIPFLLDQDLLLFCFDDEIWQWAKEIENLERETRRKTSSQQQRVERGERERERGVGEMRVVGLTGGIASGKSTVSDLFKSSGVPVVDADLVARDVVKKGTRGWKKIVKAFGNDILLENGEIDRTRLGQIVFSDPTKRQLLNRLLAPHISFGIFWTVAKLWLKGCEVIVLDIPLLFETKMDRWTKPVIVVWVDPETQLRRLMERDGSSEEAARNRIQAQTPLDWKKTKADMVIDNSGSREETRAQFEDALSQITKPLTWKELGRSRKGVTWILAYGVFGALMIHKHVL